MPDRPDFHDLNDPDEPPASEPADRAAEKARALEYARAIERGSSPGVGMVERLKEDEEESPEDAPLLLQVASGFVFTLFVVLIGLMAIAVVRQKPIGDAIPAGGAMFVVGIGLVLLALLIAATRVRDRTMNNLLVGMILGVAAIGLAVVALKGFIGGIIAGK
jgi:hypothetical protein